MRSLMVAIAILILCLLPSSAAAQTLPTENDALALAVLDHRSIHPDHSPYIRHLFVWTGEFEDYQASSFALNLTSRSNLIRQPTRLQVRELLLVRIDLRDYASTDKDLRELIDTWELLQFDPSFSLLLTKDTFRFLPRGIKPSKFGPGQEVVRFVSEHLNPRLVVELIDRTSSQAPVVSFDYFIYRALSTIQDDRKLYKDIWGGLYYQFKGINKSKKKGQTDEDLLFDTLGAGGQAGETAKQIYDRLRSDQRLAMETSQITGKGRRVIILRTRAAKPDVAQSLIFITHDYKSDNLDIGSLPMANLLSDQRDAGEYIWEDRNGLPGFGLFDGEGARQDVVPTSIAADRTVPSPYRVDLQPAIGCIRCHGPHRLWQPMKNDVERLALSYKIDIFGDLSDLKNRAPDTVARLVGLYAGRPEAKVLPIARMDHARAVLLSTGPWKKSKDQTDVAELASARISKIYADYWYTSVTPKMALRKLGIESTDKTALAILQKSLPPVGPLVDGTFVLEDPRIAGLLTDIPQNPSNWELVRSIVATRIAAARAKK